VSNYTIYCFKYITALLTVFLATLGFAQAQTTSNAGKEFWCIFPTHVPDLKDNGDPDLAKLSIFITGREASSGTVSVGTFSQTFTVQANQVTEVNIPRNQAYIGELERNRILYGRGIHIIVDQGQAPIVAYAHIFASNRSAATLLLPVEALGQKYFATTLYELDSGLDYITVVATEDSTRVHIKYKDSVDIVPDFLLEKAGDVYHYITRGDLSGLSISVDTLDSACKHFAVFAGTSNISIGIPKCNSISSDPLFQQSIPVESWGYNYGVVPFSTYSPNFPFKVRQAGQFVKVVASENNTEVTINQKKVAVLDKGGFYMTPKPVDTVSLVSANRPITVAQFAVSQNCNGRGLDVPNPTSDVTGYGDPDMVLLNPVEFSINDITVYSSTKEHIKEQYINVLIRTASAPSFRVNGKIPSGSFQTAPNIPGYSYLQLNLNSETTNNFHLTADEGFNAVAYGFGNVESYSYSAGTNLASNQKLAFIKKSTGLPIDSACVEDDYFIKLTLPFKSSSIAWLTDSTASPVIQDRPAFKEVVANGRHGYEYTLPKPAGYLIAGLHQLKITASYATTLGGCSNGAEEISRVFKVIVPPVTAFSFDVSACENLVRFSDKSIDNTNKIVSWVWDFGDPTNPGSNLSSLQNPSHSFPKAGQYIVRLTTITAAGCSFSATDTINLSKPVIPGFTATGLSCEGSAVTLKDTSRSNIFHILSRKWFFGDGDSLDVRNGVEALHNYRQPGRYIAKMVLTSTEGCISDTAFVVIPVDGKMVAGFSTPGLCLSDQVAVFTNLTQPSVNTAAIYRYSWHFGDSAASAGNPDTSNLENPTHRYSMAGNYKVKLIVTSSAGCTDTLTKTFTVNGIIPKADFSLPGNGQICEGQTAVFTENSQVLDFGSVIKLEWFFDTEGHPDDKLVVNTLNANHLYSYQYPVGLSTVKTYVVKLLAYSGQGCVDSVKKSISVYPIPQITFDSLNPVCVNQPAFHIAGVSETAGLSGIGVFSGNGISADGLFNPAIAGVGTHQINYLFTTASGCTSFKAREIIVSPLPAIHLPAYFHILKGEQVELNPGQQQTGLSYRWSPSIGLDHDNVASPKASPLETITYSCIISNGNCESQATTTVTVTIQPFVFNTFTPNGDGVNDLLKIDGMDNYPDAKLNIFNRYGSPVFSSKGYTKQWDGKYNGHDVPAGVYYRICLLKRG
jgi:gliding motility-associated-like protein